jgi:hypothetical protein
MCKSRALAASTLLISLFCVSCKGISEPESVLTQHNDRRRTGVYNQEKVLTVASVSAKVGSTTFGRLCVRKVEGQIVAQPLFVKGTGLAKDMLIVATRKNFIYAFDTNITDQNASGLAWGPIELTGGLGTPETRGVLHAEPLPGMEDVGDKKGCQQTHGPVGITSTPVIDPAGWMYVVFRAAPPPTADGDYGQAAYFLVRINVMTGQEVSRTAIGADTPAGHFDPNAELNRPGLLLMKNPLTGTNVLYVAFGAPVCDSPRPFDGWVFAYSAPDLVLLDTYVTAPQSHGAGIWQSGAGLAGASVGGAVYAMTGNNAQPDVIASAQTGTGNTRDDRYDPSRTDLGESILKLKLDQNDKFICASRYKGFCITDHFTAGNWYKLDSGYDHPGQTLSPAPNGDSDLGSGGPVLLPNGWVVGAGKQGRMYVLDPSHMHDAKQGFQFSYNTWHPWMARPQLTSFTKNCKLFFADTTTNTGPVADPQANAGCSMLINDYDFDQAFGPNVHGAPVVWDNAGQDYGLIYTMAEKDFLRAYKFHSTDDTASVEEQASKTTEGNTQMHPRGFDQLRSPDGMPGGALSLSTNGNPQDSILWVSVSPCHDTTNFIRAGTLMAFNAQTLQLLWFADGTNPDWGDSLCQPPQGVDQYTTPRVAFAKFVAPTIGGGKVFQATFGDEATCRNQKSNGQWISCGSVIFYGLRTRRPDTARGDTGIHP